MFCCFAVLLAAYAISARNDAFTNARIDLDLWWGAILFGCGALLLHLSRGSRR
jgi:hypothetical protein